MIDLVPTLKRSRLSLILVPDLLIETPVASQKVILTWILQMRTALGYLREFLPTFLHLNHPFPLNEPKSVATGGNPRGKTTISTRSYIEGFWKRFISSY